MLKILYRLGARRKVMTRTNVETTSIFHQVSERMLELGYTRLLSQIRPKFKKEKGFFYECMEEHGGLPQRRYWGARFGLLRWLWVQVDKPNLRLRRPAGEFKITTVQ